MEPMETAGHWFVPNIAARPVSPPAMALNGDENMTDEDYRRKLGEVDRVLNDPDLPLQPALIWQLLAEISNYESQGSTMVRQRLG